MLPCKQQFDAFEATSCDINSTIAHLSQLTSFQTPSTLVHTSSLYTILFTALLAQCIFICILCITLHCWLSDRNSSPADIMIHFPSILAWSAVLATVDAHGVILGAQGPSGPSSFGFRGTCSSAISMIQTNRLPVDPAIARNCTTINPCQQDATLIRTAEIEANIVNECGRTELMGNIDIGEETENALQAKRVTQVTKGSKIQVTVHQVNADGAGPYTCDLDMTSNGKRLVGQIPLTVENNVPGINGFSQAKAQNFNMTVVLPDDLACIGGMSNE